MDLSEYRELNLTALEDLVESPCNIYLVLPSGKRLVISQEGNLINLKMIKKYQDKQEVKVLVHTDDYPIVVRKRIEKKVEIMKERLSEKQWINRVQRFDNELNSIAMIRASASLLGINDTTLELVEDAMESTLYSFEKIPSLKTILGDICGRGDFFLQKALMINYLAIFAIQKSPWNNEATRNKLSMAAFLHDFKTTDINLIKSKLDQNASDEEKKLFEDFMKHSESEYQILSKINEVPDDVTKIVRYHHVDVDGTGFPLTEVGKLSPLSQTFNISHNLAVVLINEGFSKKSYSGYFYDLSGRILEKYKDSLDPFSYIL